MCIIRQVYFAQSQVIVNLSFKTAREMSSYYNKHVSFLFVCFVFVFCFCTEVWDILPFAADSLNRGHPHFSPSWGELKSMQEF